MSASQNLVALNEIMDELQAKITNCLMQQIESMVAKKSEDVLCINYQGTDNEKRNFELLGIVAKHGSTIRNRGGVENPRLKAKDPKKSEAKDRPSKDRPSRGQGPRT